MTAFHIARGKSLLVLFIDNGKKYVYDMLYIQLMYMKIL